jgi:LysM repeat protein
MTPRTRALITVAFAVIPIGLISACGTTTSGGEGSRATLQYTPATNYGLKEPATTTTTTTTLVPVAPPVGGTSPDEQMHTIAAGDSLFKIAGQYDVTPELICTYNGWPDCIDPPHLLLPGDQILIPPGSQVPGAAGGSSETDTIDSDTDGAAAEEQIACQHTVVAGDTPIRISERYDVGLRELELANLANPAWNHFQIGSSINIPASGTC